MSETALPTLEALIEGKSEGTESPKIEAVQPKETEEGLDRIEREQKHRREIFAAQKRIKELEAKQRDIGDKASILDSKNPIKELAKQKNFNKDDVVRMALEAMDDDLTPEEKNADLAKMTPEEIAKLVRKQMEEEKAVETQKQAEQESINKFKENIAAKAKELVDQYPLVDAFNASGSVFELINQQFLKDVNEYGEDYARENLMKPEEAIKKANEMFANNVKSALQSKHVKDFVMKIIKEDGSSNKIVKPSEDLDQLEDESFTLSNKTHRAATEATGKPKFNTSEEELDYLINKLI